LSSPVLCWFGTYHRPGRLTVGLNNWVVSSAFAPGNRGLNATLRRLPAATSSTALVTLAPGSYRATWNMQPIPVRERLPGALEITLPPQPADGRLVVTAT
jgi:hypothetical protein